MHLKGKKDFFVNNGIAFFKGNEIFLPSKPMLSIYKSFLRPNLFYSDVIYGKCTTKSL